MVVIVLEDMVVASGCRTFVVLCSGGGVGVGLMSRSGSISEDVIAVARCPCRACWL